MKKIIVAVALIATVFVQKSFAQDSTSQSGLSNLLTQYYSIKDALIAGNGGAASSNASLFVKTLNGIDAKVIAEDKAAVLQKDATAISETADIKKQREYFADFSTNMVALAKSVKLTNEPVYQAYCPMKKAAWLSSNKVIKNPYYGSAMLTCGKVVETINQ
jgi:hypothetical protein